LQNNQVPSTIIPAVKRLAIGLLYVSIFQVGSGYVNQNLLFSDTFKVLLVVFKFVYLKIL